LTGTLRTTPREIKVGSVTRTPKFKRKLNTEKATKEKSTLLMIKGRWLFKCIREVCVFVSIILPSRRADMPQMLGHGKSLGETKSSAPVRSRIRGTALMKTKLAPPRTVRYTAASPNFALPRTSLNRT